MQPLVSYDVPQCVSELLPYQNKQAEIAELAAKLSGAVGETKVKKSAAKDKKTAVEQTNTNMLLNIPRSSLNSNNVVELPVTNNSELPLWVQLDSAAQDDSIRSYDSTFKLVQTSKQLRSADIQSKGDYKTPPSVTYVQKSKNLLIKNTKFCLKAHET